MMEIIPRLGRNCPTMSDLETICHCGREGEISQYVNVRITLTRAPYAQSDGASGHTVCIEDISYSKDFLYRNLERGDLAICRGEQHGIMALSGFIAITITITCLISPCYSILL